MLSQRRGAAEIALMDTQSYSESRSPTQVGPWNLRDKINQLTGQVIDTAMHIHRQLGPGLLESVYEAVLAHELRKRSLDVEVQVPIPVHWEGMILDVGFRADIIVADLIIVELKSVELIAPVHKKQLLTYLKVADKRAGLLLNFGATLLKDGIVRTVNNLPD